jgi:hypothetical protein
MPPRAGLCAGFLVVAASRGGGGTGGACDRPGTLGLSIATCAKPRGGLGAGYFFSDQKIKARGPGDTKDSRTLTGVCLCARGAIRGR